MLNGRPVLVVEEEFLIALDLQRILETLSAGQMLHARNPAEAHLLQQHWPQVCLGLIEMRDANPQAVSLARELLAAGIPVVLVGSDSATRRGVPGLDGVPVVIKPVPEDELAYAIQRVLAHRH